MGGADSVTVRDRREATDRGAEQPPERLGLGLAQLGELGRDVRDGDVVIGVRSNGVHSNGLSLARKAFFEDHRYAVDRRFDELGATIGDKVRIVETRPMSARKRWRVIEIVQKAAK